MADKTDTTKYKVDKLYFLDVDDILHDAKQPRKYFDKEALQELEQSIKSEGVLNPILFRQSAQGLIIVAGERRLQAAKNIGLKKIPALLCDNQDVATISLIENLLREDLTPIEEAEAITLLQQNNGYSLKVLSTVLHKSISTLSESLKLMKLPQDIRDICRDNPKWSTRRLLEIAKQPNDEKRRALFKLAKEQDLTGDQLRKIRKKRKTKRSRASFAIATLGTVKTHLEKIDMSGIDQDEKSKLKQGLETLRDFIEERLRDDFGAPKF